jgi:hypothetical protein
MTNSIKHAIRFGAIFTFGSFIGHILITLLKETPFDYERAVFVSIFTGAAMMLFELIRFSKNEAKRVRENH